MFGGTEIALRTMQARNRPALAEHGEIFSWWLARQRCSTEVHYSNVFSGRYPLN